MVAVFVGLVQSPEAELGIGGKEVQGEPVTLAQVPVVDHVPAVQVAEKFVKTEI